MTGRATPLVVHSFRGRRADFWSVQRPGEGCGGDDSAPSHVTDMTKTSVVTSWNIAAAMPSIRGALVASGDLSLEATAEPNAADEGPLAAHQDPTTPSSFGKFLSRWEVVAVIGKLNRRHAARRALASHSMLVLQPCAAAAR